MGELPPSIQDIFEIQPTEGGLIQPFVIRRYPMSLRELSEIFDDFLDGLVDTDGSLAAAVKWTNEVLGRREQRLPGRSEFVRALGGSIFPWGELVPEWPCRGKSLIASSLTGVAVDVSFMTVELVDEALMLGDWGAAAYELEDPWTWVSCLLATKIRASPQHHYGELLADAADETWIHPVNDMLVMPDALLQADPSITGIENPARTPYMLPSW